MAFPCKSTTLGAQAGQGSPENSENSTGILNSGKSPGGAGGAGPRGSGISDGRLKKTPPQSTTYDNPFQHRQRIVDIDLVLSDRKGIAARADARVDGREAASKICEYGDTSGLQRYVRLESGSGIVLCDFYKAIELVTNFIGFTPKVFYSKNDETSGNDFNG